LRDLSQLFRLRLACTSSGVISASSEYLATVRLQLLYQLPYLKATKKIAKEIRLRIEKSLLDCERFDAAGKLKKIKGREEMEYIEEEYQEQKGILRQYGRSFRS
jgi:hypothetical protein